MCVQKCIVQELVINKITFFRCVQLNNSNTKSINSGESTEAVTFLFSAKLQKKGMKSLPQKEQGFLLNPKKSIHNEKRALPVSDPRVVKFPGQNPDSVVTKPDAKKKRVEETIKLYRETLTKLSRERKANPEDGTYWTHHLKAAKLMQDQGKCGNTSKRFGHVPGINIGDEFLYRAELKIIGLHGQFINDIDYMRTPLGKLYPPALSNRVVMLTMRDRLTHWCTAAKVRIQPQ